MNNTKLVPAALDFNNMLPIWITRKTGDLSLPHFEGREYINDFASRVRRSLHDAQLAVTEALWKGKPLGGDTGGIRLQAIGFHTGFLVSTPEGAALRMRYLSGEKEKTPKMGVKAKEFVRENFLLTRHLRECLTLMVSLQHGAADRIKLS